MADAEDAELFSDFGRKLVFSFVFQVMQRWLWVPQTKSIV